MNDARALTLEVQHTGTLDVKKGETVIMGLEEGEVCFVIKHVEYFEDFNLGNMTRLYLERSEL